MKRTRKRSAVVDVALFIPAWTVMHVVQWLPWSMAIGLGKALGRLQWALGGRRRARVLNHFRLVFGDTMTAAERERLARESYTHFGVSLVEMIRQPLITRANWRRFVPEEDVARLVSTIDRGGTILISCHLGAYSWGAHVGAIETDGRFVSVQRPLDNPWVNRLVEGLRTSGGLGLISKFDSFLAVRKALNEKKTVALIVDQDGGKRGIFVDFLGTPASSWTSAAELHLLTKRPLVVSTAYREGHGPRQRIVTHDPIEFEDFPEGLDKEAKRRERDRRVEAITARLHAMLGDDIRAHPEQWMWLHRRWKTRPAGESIPLVDGVPCPWLADAGDGKRAKDGGGANDAGGVAT